MTSTFTTDAANLNTVMHGNCVEIMSGMQSGSIDRITRYDRDFFSQHQLQDFELFTCSFQHKRERACWRHWSSILTRGCIHLRQISPKEQADQPDKRLPQKEKSR
jgi:hypothetical protein